jgi:hypothetical protein
VRNHDQKIKDMAESVLPSTGRKAARQRRRNLHHTERARTRTSLYNWVRSAERADLDISPASTYRSDIRELVYDRRAGDKVGPLVRWALRKVDTDPALMSSPWPEQVEAFRGLLPDNLIGRHALLHIETALRWRSWRPERTQPWWSVRAERDLDQVRAQVRLILETGRHKELNRRIKGAFNRQSIHVDTASRASLVPSRLLFGVHDVDDFAAYARRHDTVRRIVVDLADPRGPC